ncbi:MAG: hemolysin III family protein, partial [Planctomycetota bacterium]
FYLTLGWFGGVSAVFLVRRYGFDFIKPLLWGGIAYSIGGVADFLRWPTVVPRVVEGHEVFHVAVLVGAVYHWLFIWQFADGEVQAPAPAPAGPDRVGGGGGQAPARPV